MDKKCILEDKICFDCGKCDDICDLDPNKICDSCGKCIDTNGNDYRAITITEIIEDEEEN